MQAYKAKQGVCKPLGVRLTRSQSTAVYARKVISHRSDTAIYLSSQCTCPKIVAQMQKLHGLIRIAKWSDIVILSEDMDARVGQLS